MDFRNIKDIEWDIQHTKELIERIENDIASQREHIPIPAIELAGKLNAMNHFNLKIQADKERLAILKKELKKATQSLLK